MSAENSEADLIEVAHAPGMYATLPRPPHHPHTLHTHTHTPHTLTPHID